MVQSAREAVISYIKAMDERNYAAARNYLGDNVRVKGPGGEAFRNPDEFLKMMEQQRGKYDIKKVFVDGSDVCLLYRLCHPKGDYVFLLVVSSKGREDKFDPDRLRSPRICAGAVTHWIEALNQPDSVVEASIISSKIT